MASLGLISHIVRIYMLGLPQGHSSIGETISTWVMASACCWSTATRACSSSKSARPFLGESKDMFCAFRSCLIRTHSFDIHAWYGILSFKRSWTTVASAELCIRAVGQMLLSVDTAWKHNSYSMAMTCSVRSWGMQLDICNTFIKFTRSICDKVFLTLVEHVRKDEFLIPIHHVSCGFI